MVPGAALLLSFAVLAFARPEDDEFGLDVERFVSELGSPDKRISEGLPPELPLDYGRSDDFIAFDLLKGARPIIGLRITFDGRAATGQEIRESFRDEHSLRLPPGGTIRRLNAGTPEELWDFPEGTRLLHRLELADPARTLFEFRLIERRPNGQWAYGTYVRTADAKLRLLQAQEAGAYEIELAGRPVKLELTRLHPESCRRCHAMNSAHRYPDPEKAGPCAFGPGHPTLRTEWARRFRERFGREPFEN